MRVLAARDVSAEQQDLVLELKTNDVIVVLSKTSVMLLVWRCCISHCTIPILLAIVFYPRDAARSVVLVWQVICPSVCL